MPRKQVGIVAALFAVGAVALTACGQGAAQSGSAVPAQEQAQEASTDESGVDFLRGSANSNKADQNTGDRAPAAASPEVKQKWVELRVTDAGGLEPAVVNGKGLSVYWFSDDPVKGGVSNCNGDCAKTWAPITVTKGTKLFFPGIKRENIGFVQRRDGATQVTIGGRPVYLFNRDEKPGDILGQNVGNKWFVINPEGKRAVAPAEAPATQPAPPAPGTKPANSVTFFTGKKLRRLQRRQLRDRRQGRGQVRGPPWWLQVALPGRRRQDLVRAGLQGQVRRRERRRRGHEHVRLPGRREVLHPRVNLIG